MIFNIKMMNNEKILLALLPFWNPLIPPMGISSLKSFLQAYGYTVKIIDANVERSFKDFYDEYFETLKEYVARDKRGNFYNLGNEVLKNHMMAHLHYTDEGEYTRLVKDIVYKTFYCRLADNRVSRLNKIISLFYSRFERYFLNLLARERPGVLGLSVYNVTAAASLFAFKLAKETYPHIKTIMGGGIFAGELPPGSANFDFFLEKNLYIDKIIVGEGELLFLKYLQGRLDESQRVYTAKDIGGEILNLDGVGLPDFSDLDVYDYPNLAAYTSRSCPFQCRFCSETVLWGKYRKKKAKQVVKELSALSKQHHYQLFLLADSLLNPIIQDLAYELEQCDTSIYWDGYLKADPSVCNSENTLSWRRSGFYRARLGLESGSPRVLKWMDKKITPAQIKEAVSCLAYAGIKTTTYWVIGYPGETEEDFRQTLALIEELKDDIYEADCNPFSYFFTGQVHSQQWAEGYNRMTLYPEKAREMLIFQTWILKGEPKREQVFKRVCRFVEHCGKLGIPNPYSIKEIYEADERWKQLHKNSVPSMVEFLESRINKGAFIGENKKVKQVLLAKSQYDKEDWGF